MSSGKPASRETLYADKAQHYFSGARHDMLALLSAGAASHILEIGCGDGATGAVALSSGKASHYCGVELVGDVAERARQRLSQITVGDIENLDLAPFAKQFDALIMSEVIEHLVDPWVALGRLKSCLKPGGEIIASSPNIAHRAVIGALISGRFDYQNEGVMDLTHLRWFTPHSYRALFTDAGFIDIRLLAVRPPGRLARLFNRLTGNRYAHLSMTQIMIHARLPR